MPNAENGLPDPEETMARLFPRRRVRLIVEADLDPVAGWGDNPEDWRKFVQRHLDGAVPHYNPTVTVERHLPPAKGDSDA